MKKNIKIDKSVDLAGYFDKQTDCKRYRIPLWRNQGEVLR